MTTRIEEFVRNGKTHTREIVSLEGGMEELTLRDEMGRCVAWFRRPVAPHAAVPLMPSPAITIHIHTEATP